MSLASILAALQQAGASPAADDLSDILWLAAWLNRHAPPALPKQDPPPLRQRGEKADPPERDLLKEPEAREAETTQTPSEKVALHAAQSLNATSGAGGGSGALPVRAPAGIALPGALELGRQLRPLCRRVSSAHRVEIDETASAHAIAQTRIWLPMLRPEPVRAFDLALVVESSESMIVWRETIRELCLLFERSGAFRSIRPWYLTAQEAGPPQLRHLPASQALAPESLVTGGSRQIVLVVSDCVAPAWRHAPLWETLSKWGERHPVSLLQLMPQRLWSMNGLAEVDFVRVSNSSQRLVPNTQLTYKEPLSKTGRKLNPIPITTLEPEHLGRWAAVAAGRGNPWLPAAVFDTSRPLPARGAKTADSKKSEAPALVRRFLSTASPLARRLLSLLAAAPLSLAVMRLIQRALLPESRQSHLAEVFVSGLLLRRKEAPGTESEAVSYDFLPDIRELLLDSAMVENSLAVQEKVSSYVELRFGQGIDFQAFLSGAHSLPESTATLLGPFAAVSAQVFSRLGMGEMAVAPPVNDDRPRQKSDEPEAIPKKWVLIAGTGEFEIGMDLAVAADLVGKAVAKAGYGLITGGWRGVDHVAARAFYSEVHRLGRNADLWLKQGRPYGFLPDFRDRKTGRILGELLPATDRGSGARPSDFETSAKADAAILIGGREGTRTISRRLLEEKKPVLPIRMSGGCARAVFDEMLSAWDSAPVAGLERADFERLSEAVPQAAEICAALLGKLFAAPSGALPAGSSGSASVFEPAPVETALVIEEENQAQLIEAPQDAPSQLECLQIALAEAEAFSEKNPFSEEASREVSIALWNLVDFLATRGLAGDAELAFSYLQRFLAVDEALWSFTPDLAGSLNNLSNRLSALGRREDALATAQRAVFFYETLAKENPDAFTPDLARSLNNLANRLSALGRREDALATAQRAVSLRESLAKENPDAFTPDLARSLNNLANMLSALGRREDALATAQRAVFFYETLAKENPDAFTPDLASSLNNLANRLSDLGRREDALATAQRAVLLRETLAKENPDAFTPDLARSLNNLANMLSALGRREDALATAQRAVFFYETLAKENPDAFTPDLARSLNNLANMLSALGRREDALATAQRAVFFYETLAKENPDAFTPDLASSLHNLANRLSDLGRREDALATAQRAVLLRETLAKENPDAFTPDLASSLNNLANMLSALGRREDALATAQRAVFFYETLAKENPDAFTPDLATSLNNLATRLSDLGRREDALATAQRALLLRESLAKENPDAFTPDLARSLNNLATRLSDLGRREDALATAQRAVSLRESLAKENPDAFTPDLARSLNNLANMLSALGRREDALATAQRAVFFYETLAKENPDAFTPDLASSLNNLANRLSDLGRREDALATAQRAVLLRETLAKENPDAFTPDLARSLNNLANMLSALGRREDALATAQRAVFFYETLAKENPDAFTPDLARSLNNLANMLSALGRREDALATAQRAVFFYETLAKENPDAFTPDLARSLNNLATRLSDLGRREDALATAQRAVSLRESLAKENPDAFTPDLASSLNNLANRLSALGRREDALATAQRAVFFYETLAKENPDAFTPDLATSLHNLANMLSALGRREDALATAQRAVLLRETLAKENPDAFTPDLAGSLHNLANRLSALGRREDALATAQRAVFLREALAKAHPDAFIPDLASSLHNLANRLSALGRHKDALATAQHAVFLRETLAKANPDAFTPDLASSLSVLRDCLYAQSQFSEALKAGTQALNLLSPYFLSHPQAHREIMAGICRDYIQDCESADVEPDLEILQPIIEVFQTIESLE